MCLLKSGANINATSWDGYSALIKASKEGNVDLTQFLIENGADVNAKTKKGVTPLIYAAKNGHQSMIEILIVKGADVHSNQVCKVFVFVFAIMKYMDYN